MRKYWDLFIVFLKIGSLTFGGGYAMLPIIQREIVEDKGWATDEEIVEYYAIGQCTPGAIAVNTSTFVGYRIAGTFGGIIATIGFVLPAFVIICIIAGVLQNFADLAIVKNAFAGIRVCACVLIINAIIKMWKSSINDFFSLIIFIAAFFITVVFSISPVIPVLVAAGLGLAGGIILRRRNSPYEKIFANRNDTENTDEKTDVLPEEGDQDK